MTADQRRDARAAEAKNALSILKSHPKYANAAIQIFEQSTEIAHEMAYTRYVRNPKRLASLLKLFDIWASAVLQVITTPEMQAAYATLLDERAKHTWEQYIGETFEALPPIGRWEAEWIPILETARKWTLAGYKSLVELPSQTIPAVQRARLKTVRQTRHPNAQLLENREGTLNRAQAAEALGVSPRHFDRLRETHGLTGIGPTSRKRYAVKELLRISNHRAKRKHRD